MNYISFNHEIKQTFCQIVCCTMSFTVKIKTWKKNCYYFLNKVLIKMYLY